MEIKSCVVNTISKEELYDIETICFKQDIIWCGSGRNHLKMSVDAIKIDKDDKDMSIISEEYPDHPYYSGEEFIKKFGKVTGYKSKYRIKNKKEFIVEFGEHWRNDVEHGFVDSMDCLFGRKLTEGEAKECLSDDSSLCIDTWSVSKAMVTEIKEEKMNTRLLKPSIIDRAMSIQKTTLNDSLYRHRKVNLNQND